MDKVTIKERKQAVISAMTKQLGMFCRAVRLRNGLSQEYVSFRTGISDRSIYTIELHYTASLDLVNALYLFYMQSGYISWEEHERYSIKNFI